MTNSGYTAPSADAFCAVFSRLNGEPLYGTALNNEVWLMMAYDRPWGARATEENELPETVQAWLQAQAAAVGGRVQFIKQQGAQKRELVSFFVAAVSDRASHVFRYDVTGYEALTSIDVAGLLRDLGDGRAQRHTEPLYLVCTNGRRDRCCALFGREVYRALRALAGDSVWQTTHVGGHRFAGNVVTFPDGLFYGRVLDARDAGEVHAAHAQGEVALPYLRGRSCYEEGVQAAEYFLREATGERRVDAFLLEEVQHGDNETVTAVFEARGQGRRYAVSVQAEALDIPLLASCGKPGEGVCGGFRLLDIQK